LNAYNFYEQSRRDDMESIGNILIFFSRGAWLPWMEYENNKSYNYEKIDRAQKDFRNKLTLEELCSGLPGCFLEYMNHCRNECKFNEAPKYQHLIEIF
jgi:hypothetical protein